MKTYRSFATKLLTLLGDAQALRIISPGYMPLSIEDIGISDEGHRQISLCHYGEQNGDLMRDPDMVFDLMSFENQIVAEPVSFRNDYMGISQEVYRYDECGNRTHVNPKLKRELKSFAIMWFKNLQAQGFFDADVKKERLS